VTILPISTDPPPRVLALILVLGLTFSSCSPSPERKGEAPPADPSMLRPGAPVMREIGGRESHTYRLSLEPGQYLQLRIDQQGVDVAAKLVSPGREETLFFDDPKYLEEPDRLALVIKEKGVHQLVVTVRDPTALPGSYKLVLWGLARAGKKEDRIAAERIYSQGRRVLLAGAESREGKLQGLALFEKAMTSWERAGDRQGQVDALFQIAEIHNDLGNSEAAIAPGEQALRLAERARYVEGKAKALQALGNAYARLKNPSKAIDLWTESLVLWKALGNADRQGTVLQSMGVVFWLRGEFENALNHLGRAIQLLHAVGDRAGEANALVAWAGVKLDQGDTATALGSLEKGLKLSRDARAKRVEAQACFHLARLYRLRGEYETALRYFTETLEMNLDLGDSDAVPYIRQALGSVLFNLGEPEKALAEYTRLFQESRDEDLRARLLTNIGWIHQAMGDLEKALGYYDQALSLNRGREDPLSPTDQALHNTGVAYAALGRTEQGLSFLNRALASRTERGERNSQAGTLLEIGTAYRKLGDYGRATERFGKALELARWTGNTGLQAECLFRWAMLERDEGRLKESLHRLKESLGIIESVRSRVVSDSLRTSFFASKRAYYDFYLELLMQLEKLNPGEYETEAFEASERARTRGLLDLIAEGKIEVNKGIPPELRRKEIELSAHLSVLQAALDRQSQEDSGKTAALRTRLNEIQEEMENLEAQIRNRYRYYAEVRYPSPLHLQEVQRLLDSRTALLEYFTGQSRSFLFVVTQDGLESYELPSEAEISQRVREFLGILQKRGERNLGKYRRSASLLYKELLGPAEEAIARKPSLLIAPDGPLYLLPFEALVKDRESGQSYEDLSYLLRWHAISYVPSASVLEGIREPRSPLSSPAPKSFLAFADPVYGNWSERAITRGVSPGLARATLKRLPESAREVAKIATLYRKNSVQLYLGEAATEQNVKTNRFLEGAREVHFATHAYLDEERPELSGLELTIDPRSPEDGVLRVEEIFNLHLRADLLTLSACRTGLGKGVRGEGMIGLTRAFFYAGARSLLVSLWPVLDRSTADLMFDFYKIRNSSSPQKGEALRQAKMGMIESSKYAHPYYWAPFILVGDPH
jgi:CHAT domain-containing protein/tetratricopeptide (TPR) repeat protein